MEVYKVGDSDQRPWGSYVVTAVGYNEQGEEYCEKEITVNPWQVLSLQSHEMRRETWTVVKGTLTVLLDGKSIELKAGEFIHVPQKSIHCMANLGTEDCVVRERQEGMCREEDIHRYVDAYGRGGADAPASPVAVESIAVYNEIMAAIKKLAD
jgi:mannose-6-phosphate isomerase-like protein (cupin superfamily)